MKTIRKAILSAACILLGAVGPVLTASAGAQVPYDSYNYAPGSTTPVPAPAPYLPDGVFSAADIGASAFKEPQDFYFSDTHCYIADTGNNRIVVTDARLRFVREITGAKTPEGPSPFNAPASVYTAPDGGIYVADTGNSRVVVLDAEDHLTREITRPDSDLLAEAKEFKPSRLAVDSVGTVYVLCQGIYEGALLFNRAGEFEGFFGSNRVHVTIDVLMDHLWKQLLSATQVSKMARSVPVEYVSLDMGRDGYLYTCTGNSASTTGQLKRLNPNGNNVWEENIVFGDMQTEWQDGKTIITRMIDVKADAAGFITGLDLTKGRLFQCDREGNPIYVFGQLGNQAGTFKTPVAVESHGDAIYVLDAAKGSITRFAPTDYGRTVRRAISLYGSGDYDGALADWEKVLGQNGNLNFVYTGLGKAYYSAGDYEKAMASFRLGVNTRGYSDAFKEYRKDILRQVFPLLITLAAAALGALAVLDARRRRRKKAEDYVRVIHRWRYPAYTALHPSKGYDGLLWEKKGSLVAANLLLGAWVVFSLLKQQFGGFVTNPLVDRPDNVNLWVILAGTLAVFVLAVLVNWAVSTLMEGKGRLRDIWIFSAYALLPVTAVGLVLIPVSHVVTVDELPFVNIAVLLSQLWSAGMLLKGNQTLHHFSLKKTLGTALLTVFGMLVIVFVIVLAVGLFSQLYSFVDTIVQELSYRWM